MRGWAPVAMAVWMVLGDVGRAQTAEAPARGPDQGRRVSVPGIEVLPTAGVPFSAVDRIAWTRPLAGGGSTTSYLEANVARDSEGRLYRERHHFGVAGASAGSTLVESLVYDPVSGTKTSCLYKAHRCSITSYHPQREPDAMRVRPVEGGLRSVTRETLGNKEMSGLPVVGTRETTRLQPGAASNDQTLSVVREFWYCPELKVNLSVTRKDPREGTQVIEMTILSRAAPDPAVFAVPAGFAVRDERRPDAAEGIVSSAASERVR